MPLLKWTALFFVYLTSMATRLLWLNLRRISQTIIDPRELSLKSTVNALQSFDLALSLCDHVATNNHMWWMNRNAAFTHSIAKKKMKSKYDIDIFITLGEMKHYQKVCCLGFSHCNERICIECSDHSPIARPSLKLLAIYFNFSQDLPNSIKAESETHFFVIAMRSRLIKKHNYEKIIKIMQTKKNKTKKVPKKM